MIQTALRFLDGHKEITLATCEGNLPKLRVFQLMKREGNMLYFATSPEKSVWRELQQNPNVELLAYADNVSVRCSGMVNFDVEDSVKQWIYDNNPVLAPSLHQLGKSGLLLSADCRDGLLRPDTYTASIQAFRPDDG